MKALYVLLIFVAIIFIIVVIYLANNVIKSDNFTKSTQFSQIGKNIKYEKKKIFEKMKIPSYVDHRTLYELYHTGVPDVYDVNGNKINGTEPNPEKVIHHLNLLLNSKESTSAPHKTNIR